MKTCILSTFSFLLIISCKGQKDAQNANNNSPRITPAAERINEYLPLLKGKRVGLFANQTSTVGNRHLVDTLLSLGVDIRSITDKLIEGSKNTVEKADSFGRWMREI